MEIRDILELNEYNSLNQFSQEDKDWINGRIKIRRNGSAGIECVKRGMNRDGDYFELTPEEIVRQHYAHKLIEKYGYKKEQISFEEPVFFAGRSRISDKRVDITVFDEHHKNIMMIIEVKRPKIDDYNKTWEGEDTTPFQQMQTYANQKHPHVGVLVNGVNPPEFYDETTYENRLGLNRFPYCSEDISEWKKNQTFTLKQLMIYDRLHHETLKDIILQVEQRYNANDVPENDFEEIFKLIFTKLFDEKKSSDNADIISLEMKIYGKQIEQIDDSVFRPMEFRVKSSETDDQIFNKINNLFKEAQMEWQGVFPDNSRLNMQPATVKSCVSELQDVKLFNSNLEVVDDAFEHLVNMHQKEKMAQYFTPRYIIDMCVKMLNPKQDEKMIDTAAGSCGFPMHSTLHVWKQINPQADNLFTTSKRTVPEKLYVQNNVFGIDYSENSVRVGRMLNIIAGDGHTNVLHLNTLDYRNWFAKYVNNADWLAKYGEGFRKLAMLRQDKKTCYSRDILDGDYSRFEFDIVMANPPFAGDLEVKDHKEQIKQYDLGHKGGDVSQKLQNKVGRDILFIERNLSFLKPGGRMAVVLPQGRFNNSTDKYIREYIMDRCRILAVVGMHGNAFKPHTGTKTSVLLVQKWTDENCGYPNICPKPNVDENGDIDYPIFFATMKEPSKDNSGDKIYVTENYVTWTSYSYKTVKIIVRKSDNTVLPEEEYNSIANKDNYEKRQKEILYIRKTDSAMVSEEEYNQKKSDYKKKTIYEYKRLSDNSVISEDEYKELTKKSAYKITIETLPFVEEHKNDDGSTRFIKDIFISKYGAIDSHKKWIKENSIYVLKEDNDAYRATITIEDWLQLEDNERDLYKKKLILGDNNNSIISNEEYEMLSEEAKKFYVVAEQVTETVERVKDTHGHIFVKHDLFNHDPALKNSNANNIYSQNGIAEAFAKFAFDNRLSFAPTAEELNRIMHPENEIPF